MNLHIFSFLRVLALLAVTLLATPLMAQTAASDAAPERPAVSAQAEALVEVLRDESAREALISELERLSRGEAAQEGAEVLPDVVPLAEESDVSFGRRVAMMTKEAAQSLVASADRLGDRLLALPSTFLALDGSDNATVLLDALKDLALVIVTTYAIFLALRGLAKPLYRRMGGTAASVGSVQTVFLMSASALIDAAIVLLAWAGGYAIALTVFGQFGEIGIRQTMYLNAFLIVELIKVAMRFILSPSAPELRLLAIGDVAARYLTRWLTVIISMLGYGQLLVIPIINQNVSFLAGRAMSSLISLMVLLIALTLVLRNRRRVAAWLTDEESHPNQTGILRFLAERWHWPVILYLAALFLIVVARPDGMLFPVLDASGKVLAAILAGMLLTGAITRGISRGVTLPDGVKRRLPLLEMRLNRFVPTTLMVVRLLVMIAVVAIAADIIGIIDLHGWLESQVGIEMSGRMIATTMILLFGFLIWLALGSWIDYRLNPEFGSVPTAREATLLSLLRNAATIAILIITLMFALSELGVDIAPLLASAGVLGLAIGFGAQKLVQDIITGVFIQFESAINVGDVITVGGTTGTVERLTIRSVSLRDLEGAYHIIPFSSVDMVTNFMRGFAYFVCDMGVAYRENTEEVREAMLDAFEELQSDPAISRDLLSRMDWMGVVSFGDNAVVVRTRVKTQPGKQWGIGRAYNAIVKRIFDERGIEMPFPHRTLYFGEDKDGAAPAARLNVTEHRVRDVTGKPADRPAPPPASDEIIHAPPDDED